MKMYRISRSFIPVIIALLLAAAASAQYNHDCTPNESWLPVGAGLPGDAVFSTEMDGDLYVLHQMSHEAPKEYTLFGMSKWDGTRWTLLTTFQVRNVNITNRILRTFKGHDGMLYLGGAFSDINGDPELRHLIRWDGEKWSPARGNIINTEEVAAVEVHNGELYAAIRAMGSGWKIARRDGSRWEYISTPAWLTEQKYYDLHTMLSHDGALYVGGGEYGNTGQTVHVMRWDGSTWEYMPTGQNDGHIMKLAAYNGRIYAVGRFSDTGEDWFRWFARWEGNAWNSTIPKPVSLDETAEFAVYDEQLYMLSGPSLFMTGPQYTSIDRFDGKQWHTVSNTNGILRTLINFSGRLFLGGGFTESCGMPLANIALICNDVNCGRINGTVFNDINGNCAQDPGEKGLARRMIAISPGEQFAITDESGRYSRHASAGTYTVSLVPHPHWNQLCPSSGAHTVTIEAGTITAAGDFGARPVPGIRDLRVTVVAGPARQGRGLTYAITYQNAGTETMNGTVRFIHDPILTFDSARATPTRYAPNMAEWDFTGLEMEQSRTIHVWTTVPVGTPIGTNICSRVEIDPQVNNYGIDNRDSVCTPVIGSYDPNDIQVTPFGVEDNGVIAPEDSVLTYWVRFQNTGNDTAFKVVVIDTLSSHINISSIRLGAASHPFSFSIDRANALVWTFDNIMLPDSNASEKNSHGFFKFSVRLKPHLPYGTEIANQVHIYFDYNTPVATNTVVSSIGVSLGVDDQAGQAKALAIYPNPARESVTISAEEMRVGSVVQIRNLLGETVRNYRYDGSGSMTLDLGGLPAGTYLVTAETSGRYITRAITVAR